MSNSVEKDNANVVISKEAGEAIEFLKSDKCEVPFFKDLEAAIVLRIAVTYALSKNLLKNKKIKLDKKGMDWTGRSGANKKGLSGQPNIYELFDIYHPDGKEDRPNYLFEQLGHYGLIELRNKIKKGESLEKIFS